VDELHVTTDVRSRVVPLLSVPWAVNCWLSPAATDGFPGDTWIEVTVGAFTVRTVELETMLEGPVKLAEMVEAPWLIVVASPPATIVATDGVDELHVTRDVRSRVLPLLNVPWAANCWVAPAVTEGVPGDIWMETR